MLYFKNMYYIRYVPHFKKALLKVVKRDKFLHQKIVETIETLSKDPKYPSLHSHKVQTPDFGERWSSRVTGDIRLIWDFDEDNNLVILVLDIGGHSGGGKVYK